MNPVASKVLKAIVSLVVVLICGFSFSANAQNKATQSRIAVVSNETKTNIWVSNFPKQASIIVLDSENNLITVTTTNAYGATYISLPVNVKNSITVKTMNGEVVASNKVVVKETAPEETLAIAQQEFSNKA